MSSALNNFKQITETVYGKYTSPQWKPKPYAEGKGRYLWTDAFGVCNYITLYCHTGDPVFLDQADILINQVHDVLGKDREGKRRLRDATDQEPTKGGLRIGKPYPEGHPDGDGQYFHYLTKWMFALNRMSLVRNTPKYNQWAIQMAKAIHPHFVYKRDTDHPRMFWKTTIDLSKPAVLSEGNLDPYDGYITYRILASTSSDPHVLDEELTDMKKMVDAKYEYYRSDDPLDLGEALWIAHWFLDEPWAQTLTNRSLEALEKLWKQGYFRMPLAHRLAFREFGTTLGVQCNDRAMLFNAEWSSRVDLIHQQWMAHLFARDADITPVMCCASLIPGVWKSSFPLKSSAT